MLSWSWMPEPLEGQPLAEPFAWALIRLDGADTAMLHAVDAGSAAAMRTGLRVRPRWAASRVGSIRDIACFEPCDGPAPPRRTRDAHRRRRRARPDAEERGRTSAGTGLADWGAGRGGTGPAVGMTVTPVRLHYEHTASPGESAYLRGLAEGRLIGQRCDVCGKVYMPPRGTCPADGVPMTEEVELPDTGTVTTFCVVNVGYPGQRVTPPYVAAAVLLDGADIAFQHLILGCDPGEVRMGMRVRAVWRPRRSEGPPGPSATSRPPASRTRPTRLREAPMTQVAVVGFAQSPCRVRPDATTSGVEMLVPIFAEVFRATGLTKADIGFWCSGSSDYLAGRAFSFVQAVDAIGAVPPVMESHVEMDGAWALYEAWVKILTGEAEIALAYGFGKSSGAQLRRVLALQLDPYLVAPLWPDSVSIAALQARLGLQAGLWTEKDMAEVAARSRAAAVANPHAQVSGDVAVEDLLGRPYVAEPLRAHDCAPVGDGAAVVIIAVRDAGPATCARGRPGSPGSSTGSTPGRWAHGTCWRCRRRRPRRRAAARRGPHGRGGRAARAVHPPGDHAPRGAGARRRRGRQPLGRRAVRQPDVRRRAGADRDWRRRRSCPAGPDARSGTRPAVRRCSRTWSASWRGDEPASGGPRRRADPAPVQAHRRVDRRAVPGGGGPRADGRGPSR